MLSRLAAIQDIRLGRGVRLAFVGHEIIHGRAHTYSVTLKRRGAYRVVAEIQCDVMRRTYTVSLTTLQVMSFIKLHYPRFSENVSIQAEPISFRKVA